MSNNISIIIPAAGLGKRMKSYGPKSLIYLVHNTTILSRQLSIIEEKYPGAEVIVVTGFEYSKIQKFIQVWNKTSKIKVRQAVNFDYINTNVAKSIAIGLFTRTNPDSLIIYGDLVFNKQTLDTKFDRSGVLLDNKQQFDKYEVGAMKIDESITTFCYDTSLKWAQIAYLNSMDCELFLEVMSTKNRNSYFGFEILNLMLEKGVELKEYYNPEMKIVEVDHSKDVDKARALAMEYS